MENMIQEAKMKKFLAISIICFFMILSSVASFAHPLQRSAGMRRMFDRPRTRIFNVLKANQEVLEITDQQMQKIQDLVYSLREKSIKVMSENGLNRLELQKLMQDEENMDYAKIEAILARTSASRHDIFIEGLKLREEIKNILTPEQQEALKQIAEDSIRSRLRDVRDRRLQRLPHSRTRIRR
jgi:Spy/CpxP family protein refolding chaperone